MLLNVSNINFASLAIPVIVSMLISYLLGSVNFAIIFTKLFINDDIRRHGSGNAGMTNVLRIVGSLPAILTFVFDFLKSVISVLATTWIVSSVCQDPEIVRFLSYLSGFVCILGHLFPVFFGFRGGKGIVTAAGMICVTDWRVFIAILAVFGVVFLMRRIISLASISCAVAFPVLTFVFKFLVDSEAFGGDIPVANALLVTLVALVAGIVVIIKHSENIKRLIAGTEKPIQPKKR